MFKLALRTVFAKKMRLLSTALSIMLGIAFLAGTLVFTDTMKRTLNDMYADINANTDAVVRAVSNVEDEMGFAARGRIPQSVVDVVRSVDGVARAEPSLEGWAQLVGADGKAIGNPAQGPPTFGATFTPSPLGPWVLTEGSRPPGPGELVIDLGSAKDGGLKVGDVVTVMTQTGPHRLPLVGTVRFGTIDSPSGASVSLFDLGTAQQLLLGRTGEIDAVVAQAVPGVSEDELTRRVAAVLPDGQEALTGKAITKEQQDMMGSALGFLGTFLLVFAIIGLVVACFTIFNTFQIVITQRIREMALLRAIGATRTQVLAAQLVEATVVGLSASVIGLFLGVGVAGALKVLLSKFGVDLPAGGTVFLPRTAIIAIVVGTVVTMGSAVLPALRASRVPPIAALRDVALDRTSQTWHRLALGTVVTAVGITGFVVGLGGAGLAWVGLGALATFLGVFVLGPLLTRPIAGPLSAPLPAMVGIRGEIARENALRNPKRTARTGGSLMVGVALVVAITVIAASAKDWVRDVFDTQFSGDFVVSTDSFAYGGLSPQLAAGINELPQVEAAAGVRTGSARLVRDTASNVQYTAVDPTTGGKVFDIGMTSGSIAALDERGVLVDNDEARKLGVGVGDQLTFEFRNGEQRQLRVEGIYTEDALAGRFVVSHALHESTGADQFDFSVYVITREGVSEQEARAAIAGITDAYPNAELLSRAAYLDKQAAQIDPIVNLMYALLALAILIALFSIANSMALSVYERIHELGLLRAVGMTLAQLRSAIRWESVLIALLGTGFGVLLGTFFGWAISVTLRQEGLADFALPARSIVIVAVLATLGTVLATTRPAWRAAHLDILRAIASE